MHFLLQQLLSHTAEKFADTEAVRCRGRSLSYRELEEQSSRLARLLAESGVERGDRVGICLPKSPEALLSIFGVLKAGAVYVPLDYGSPPRRVAWMIRDCRMRAAITTSSRSQALLDRLDQPPVPDFLLVIPEEDGKQESSAPPPSGPLRVLAWGELDHGSLRTFRPPRQTEEDLAYILYTSGSTGTPKGVMISHRAALTFIQWAAEEIALTSADRVSNHAPFQFDLSIFDIFATLSVGARLVLVPEELSAFPRDLARFWEREAITVWYSVPSVLSRLAAHGDLESRDLSALRAVLFAGEVFPVDHFRNLASLLPAVAFYNLYGPTETNVCTFHRVTDVEAIEDSIPIGRACPNADVWAVTEEGAVAAPGQTGELWVTGPLLMKGYWGQPEKTRRVFARVPAPGGWGRVRAYRTGDLASVTAEGIFHFRGRRDSMVKIRGYRVEPGEVEAALHRHPNVLEAAVVALAEGTSEAELAAILVLGDGVRLEPRALRTWLQDMLPSYMIPKVFETASRLPRTATGKIDKRLLKRRLLESEE